MNTFPHIHEALYTVSDDVVRRKKNPLLPLLILFGGAALIAWSAISDTLAGRDNLSLTLVFIGVVLSIVGLVQVIRAFTQSIPYHLPSRQSLRRKERFFDQKDKQALCDAVRAGDVARIKALPRSASSGVVLTMYATRSGSCALLQVAEYVPHRFVPMMPVVILTGDGARDVVSIV